MAKTTMVVIVCMALLAAGRLVLPAAAQTLKPDLQNRDYAAVDIYIAETMRRLPIAGLSLAIVKGDQVVYMQGYGTANQDGAPVTPRTPFMLASITKTFTALAVQQLAVAGKLDLDMPLQAVIPEFRLADESASAAITIRHLLDHTSGISTLEGTQRYVHDPAGTFTEILRRLARYRPERQPGIQREYSNLNYVLLGEVVSRSSGQPYADYVQTHILDPLRMTRASFADHHTIPGAATGNAITFGLPVPYDEPHIPVMLSAGYLTASAEDMAQYLIPYLNQGQYQGESLLPAQGKGWYDEYWNWHAGYPPDAAYGHSGGHNSFNTDFKLFVRHQLGVVVLMNTRLDTLFPAPNASQIAFNIARMVMGYSFEVPSGNAFYTVYALADGTLVLMGTSILWQGARLKGWAGRYQVAGRRKRIVAWAGIILNGTLAVAIFLLPGMAASSWPVMLAHRSDIAVLLLGAAVLLGVLAAAKLALAIRVEHSSPPGGLKGEPGNRGAALPVHLTS